MVSIYLCEFIVTGKGSTENGPVISEREIAFDENSKQQQEMAAPHHHHPSLGGDVRSSPVLAGRHSPSLGLSNGTPNMNGSLMNGGRKLSGYDPSTSQYLEKHDEAHFLANLLAEERQRCSQHKENYNTLKQEHRKYVIVLISFRPWGLCRHYKFGAVSPLAFRS